MATARVPQMSYRKQQALDFEPVTRGGFAPSRPDEVEFAPPAPFEFPEPRFAEDREASAVAAKANTASVEDNTSSRQKREPAPVAERAANTESWIVKRGHTFSYLGLFLFTFVLYFRPYELIPSLSAFSSMALVLALGTIAIFLPSQMALEGNLTARPREVNLLLLLAVTGLLSIPTALSPGEAWATFNDTFLKAVLMFIVMVNVVRTEWRLKGLIWLSLGVSCFLSLNALDNYRAGNFTVEGYRVEGNLSGMFENPNDMALHLVTMTPIAVALMLNSRRLPVKLLYGACAALMVAGNVVTFSRGGFIALAGAMLVMAWKLGRRNRFTVILVSIVVIVLFLALAPGNYGVRLLSLINPSLDPVGSSDMRRELLIRSIKVAIHNPVFGVGMGNFHTLSIHEHVSHNAYTQVAAEMGMTAMVLYILFIVTPLKRLRQIERESFEARRKTSYFYLSVGVQAALVAYMIGSFFASVAYQWYVYYLVAYAISVRRMYEIEYAGGQEPSAVTDAAQQRAASKLINQPAVSAVETAVKVEQATG